MSLDVFRGMTIIGMVLVNNPGTWSHMFEPLDHAPWDGWTPTDFIFPFFLFIVGVSMSFSFDKRLAAGLDKVTLFAQVVRRTILIFILGAIGAGFPNMRLLGPFVLCYAGIEFLYADRSDAARAKVFAVVGWILFAASAAWFLVNIPYFNGPNRIMSLRSMFPMKSETPGSAAAAGGVMRLTGVLVRIAICYFFASILLLMTRRWWTRLACALALLFGYWAVEVYVPAPGNYQVATEPGTERGAPINAPFAGHLNDYIDVKLLGDHLYKERPDPEGLLSTLPSIATVILGMLAGMYLLSADEKSRKTAMLYTAGLVLLGAGALWSLWFPINKRLWTSSFVVFMAGWALLFFALCYFILDVLKFRKWAVPFLVFGTNSILIFFGSGMMARFFSLIKWQSPDDPDKWITLQGWIYNTFFVNVFGDYKEQKFASMMYSVVFILLWLAIVYPLYRKKIFLKV